jgi:hypothetical protein
MTTPHVTELPRRLEPISKDTFLGGGPEGEQRPPGVVLQLRPRAPRRGPRPPLGGPDDGPGGRAA